MNIFVLIIETFWVVRIGLNTISYINLWFVKEYRFDRMLIHLKTKQGRRLLFMPFRVPPLSPKTLSLVILCTTSLVLFFRIASYPIFVRFILTDLLSFPITAFCVALVNLPTTLYHRLVIHNALVKFRMYPHITIIGITGSFGKTSTKEYLASILESKYRVLKTEASKNSSIAIAETVARGIGSQPEVFVVEMGAYKRGEIAEMTDMVRPTIGIVTAINMQHQDLFGDLDTTMRAKYELIAGLPHDGIAILNFDNPYTRKMGDWAKRDGKTVWWYTARENRILNAPVTTVWASQIVANTTGVSFTCHMGKYHGYVAVPVLGVHQVGNILAAFAAACACGMEFADAVKATERIAPLSKVMEPSKGVNGSLFINDTFNNNPDAARAAIDFLSKTKGKKVLVFQPMIELGIAGEAAHVEVGAYAARHCDDIILTNDNSLEYFKRGVARINPQKIVQVRNVHDAVQHIKRSVTDGDTVLFKGKEAEPIFQKLTVQPV